MSAIEEAVIEKMRQRAEVGLMKYGVSLERKDLTTLDWLVHAQEEAMDLAGYLEVLIQRERNRATAERKNFDTLWGQSDGKANTAQSHKK